MRSMFHVPQVAPQVTPQVNRLPEAEALDDEALIKLVKDRQDERSIKVLLDEL